MLLLSSHPRINQPVKIVEKERKPTDPLLAVHDNDLTLTEKIEIFERLLLNQAQTLRNKIKKHKLKLEGACICKL